MGLAGGTPRVEALARPPLPRSSAGTERFRPQGGGVQLSLTVRSRKLPAGQSGLRGVTQTPPRPGCQGTEKPKLGVHASVVHVRECLCTCVRAAASVWSV